MDTESHDEMIVQISKARLTSVQVTDLYTQVQNNLARMRSTMRASSRNTIDILQR